MNQMVEAAAAGPTEWVCLGCNNTIKEKNIEPHKRKCPGSGSEKGLVLARAVYDRLKAGGTATDEVVIASSTRSEEAEIEIEGPIAIGKGATYEGEADIPADKKEAILEKAQEIVKVLAGEAVAKTDLVAKPKRTFIKAAENGVADLKMTEATQKTETKTAPKASEKEETHWLDAGVTKISSYEVLQSRKSGKYYVKAMCSDGVERLSFTKRVVNALHGLIGELQDTPFALELEAKSFQKQRTAEEIAAAVTAGKPLTVNEKGEETVTFLSPRRIYIGEGKEAVAYAIQQAWPSNNYALVIAKRDTQAIQAGSTPISKQTGTKKSRAAGKDSRAIEEKDQKAPAAPQAPAPAAASSH